jgi:hypothetical protein
MDQRRRTTVLLDSRSPRAEHPPDCNVVLRPHQLALLHRAMQFEAGPVPLKSLIPDAVEVHEQDELNTTVGVIGDVVGSGKSFVVLALVLMDAARNDAPITRPATTILGASHVIVTQTKSAHRAFYNCTLLVIPHNISGQWERHANSFSPALNYLCITRQKQLQFASTRDVFQGRHLVIVTSTFHNQLANQIRAENVRLRRVVYDEADSINIPSCVEVDAAFTWFGTASFANLLCPKGSRFSDASTGDALYLASGLRGSGFIKNVFCDLGDSPYANLLVIKNAAGFVHECIQLPAADTHIVRCKTPASICMLDGYVERNIIAMLNAGDVNGAVSIINPEKRGTQESIVSVCISQLDRLIARASVRLASLQRVQSLVNQDTEDIWTPEIERISARIRDHQHRVDGIRERIARADMCNICLESFRNRCIVPCCAVSYCFECIMKWAAVSHCCPTCKGPLNAQDVLLVTEGTAEATCVCGTSPANNKMQNLTAILHSSPTDSKFLIFSSFENSFDPISHMLGSNGVTYAFLKGNTSQVNCTVNQYKSGGVRVLLVNSRNYGSGLDLSMTTDVVMFHKLDNEIEQQVIGRAQRIGRTAPLRLWYLLHDNENTARTSATR